MHKFPYEWSLKDANFTKDKGTVFSCFACGGGSSMGYKLAGFDVIGANDIDPKMMEIYQKNHNPKYTYLESIVTLKDRDDFPEEFYNLDILDGSPPCSSFSMAGNREKDWGKEKKFREGQQEQILDTLFFDYIALGKKLQPKVMVAENVKGLIQGDAQAYVNKILLSFSEAGYKADYILLDSSEMGVPQKRERVFFYAIRNDLKFKTIDLFGERPQLDLDFNEDPIIFRDVWEPENFEKEMSPFYKELWDQRIDSDKDISCINGRVRGKPNTGFGTTFAKPDKVCGTLTAKNDCYCCFETGRYLSTSERLKISSFPSDYNFLNNDPGFVMGMSVPPIMTAQVSSEIYKQWLKKNE